MEDGGAESSEGSTTDPVNTKVISGQDSPIELERRNSAVARPEVAVTRRPTYPQQ